MKFSGILIGSEAPDRLVEYYTKLFGAPGFSDGGYTGWQLGDGWIVIGAHDEVSGANTQPGRLVWNLETADVRSEFDRFRGAGATVVREPYDPGADTDQAGGLIATLADPDGNYFQLMSPMQM